MKGGLGTHLLSFSELILSVSGPSSRPSCGNFRARGHLGGCRAGSVHSPGALVKNHFIAVSNQNGP